MRANSRVFRLAAVLVLLLMVASCGGGKKNGAASHDKNCATTLPFTITTVPAGFTTHLLAGPMTGQSQVKGATIFHMLGPSGKYIELFRGAVRHKYKNGKPVKSVSGTVGHVGKIDGGYGGKIRLARGRCARYQFEGHGLTEAEMLALIAGLKKA